jgi:hypothetical protein
MPGYDPRCPNCHRCWHCNGTGVITKVAYDRNWKGELVKVERPDTCPKCSGRGGKVGVGKHDHG